MLARCWLKLVGNGENEGSLVGEGEEDEKKAISEISFSSLMRTVHMNDAWNLFRLHRPHGRVEEILRRPETHCFHLPFGEVTITLHDMQVLFGLRIDGDVVYMQDAAWRIRPWRTLLETLTGCAIAPADMDGASRVRIHTITGYLRDQLQVDPIGDATPVERVEKISRLYMLVILVSTVGAVQCWPTCTVPFVGHLSVMWLTFADLFLSFRFGVGKGSCLYNHQLICRMMVTCYFHMLGDGRVELIGILSHIMFLSLLETS
ncbi:hypothetical protein KY285_007228 [Solanum tuberosum]|nr:hypothetical protein KY284_007351 [Solanum tuberosum]KAH0745571.1 hypothetical protein KY285_007228 [Solanum tuberosum]